MAEFKPEFWTPDAQYGGRIREFYAPNVGTIRVSWNPNDPNDLPKIRLLEGTGTRR